MNRANFGNVVTNGLQILSVSGKNAGDFARQSKRQSRADAASALNNMSMEELSQVGKYRANQLKDEMSSYDKNKSARMLEHMNKEEASQYGQYQADVARQKMESFYGESDEESIDDILQGSSLHPDLPQTEQLQEIENKVNNDVSYYDSLMSKMELEEGGIEKILQEKHEMLNKFNGGKKENADV